MTSAVSNPGHYTRTIGDARVTALYDGSLQVPPEAILLGIPPADAEALVHAHFRAPGLRLFFLAYLVRSGGRTILIDTGAGTSMGPTAGRLLGNLAAAGVQPGEVDAVLLTHFHGDHSGGLATPDGAAVFPRAELGYTAGEAAYWFDPAQEAATPEARRGGFAAARAAAAPYQDRVRIVENEPYPGITAVPLPGHTPGHTGYQVGTGPGALLIWGDVMHVPDIQAPRPDVGVGFDVDPAQARQTRAAILERVAAERLMVAGMHMHFPGFCHLARAAEGYAIVPDTWQQDA